MNQAILDRISHVNSQPNKVMSLQHFRLQLSQKHQDTKELFSIITSTTLSYYFLFLLVRQLTHSTTVIEALNPKACPLHHIWGESNIKPKGHGPFFRDIVEMLESFIGTNILYTSVGIIS